MKSLQILLIVVALAALVIMIVGFAFGINDAMNGKYLFNNPTATYMICYGAIVFAVSGISVAGLNQRINNNLNRRGK